MFSFWDDEKEKLSPIEKYFDNLNYFTKREIIRKAVHNEVDSAVPYSAKQIIIYAQKEANESVFNASYSALNGADTEKVLIGEPEINPLTNKKNSKESQKGLIGEAKEAVGNSFKAFLVVGVIIAIAFIYKGK